MRHGWTGADRMRQAVTLMVVMAALAGGGLWLLQDGQDNTASAGRGGRDAGGDYRPGPAWLHRRLGQTISIAPFRGLTNAPLSNIGAAPSLGTWTPFP
jgi:hypothetical protein